MSNEREEFIKGLRDLAYWYEAHPDMPIPSYGNARVSIFSLTGKEDAAMALRAMAPCEKDYAPDYNLLTIKRNFGGMELHVVFNQSDVCVRSVVGKKVIPAQVVPAQPEQHIPERTEEVVVWDCGPILAPAEEKEAA